MSLPVLIVLHQEHSSPGRIGLEMRMIIAGGERILNKIAAVRDDVFRRRPVLRPWDWPLMMLRTLSLK